MGINAIEWKDLEKLLREHYHIKIYNYEKIRKVVKLITDQGIRILKKVQEPYDRFLFICEAMIHAQNNGFYTIPQVISTADGKMGIETEDGVWMLSQWIEAREADYKENLDLELTATALAKFHKAARNFVPSIRIKSRELYGKWIEHFYERCQQMLLFYEMAMGKEEKSNFDQKILHYTYYFHDWGMKSIHHLETNHYRTVSEKSRKEKTFCHHDIANHNVLLTKKNHVYLIDFDYCIMDIAIHDLASLVIRNIRYGDWQLAKAYFILDTYNKEKPISMEEIGILKAFMEFPQEFWQIGLQYYIEKQPWEKRVFYRRLNRIIEDIPKREVFMKRFLN